MGAVQLFADEVRKFWNGWEIRVLVVLSLLLQIILIIFGSWRKSTPAIWIRICVWLAYLSADWVATVSLGNLATNQGESENNSSGIAIRAFWAPFLLLHLGGPDTITAYSLEDNELWLRHFLELVVQVSVAFYVFFWSWSNRVLTFITIPVFITGMIKYGERTYVLWSASTKQFKEALLSSNPFAENAMRLVMGIKEDDFFEINVPMEESREKFNELYLSRKQVGHYMDEAHFLFKRFLYLFANLILGLNERIDCYNIIREKSAEYAFKLIAVELGFMYDKLYTKAAIIYTRLGICRRLISFLLSVFAFIFFTITIDTHPYPLTEICITYLLLAVAVFLEVYALITLISSDQTELWMVKHQKPWITSVLSTIRYLLLNDHKRWSESMAQYNLISSCVNREKEGICFYIQKVPSVNELLEYLNSTWRRVDVPVQKMIFEQLKEKGDKIKDKNTIKLCKELLDRRGDYVLREKYKIVEPNWRTVEVEFDHSLLVWHIATDICCSEDFGDISVEHLQVECKISKRLSEYMLYLLVMCPSMLPTGIGEIRYRDTCNHVKQFSKNKDKEEIPIPKLLFKMISRRPINQSVLSDGCELARKLQSLKFPGDRNCEEKWKMISEVWVEILAYAASHCGWKEHAQQLRRGGELLTHVCLLMAHLGLSEQYNENERFYIR